MLNCIINELAFKTLQYRLKVDIRSDTSFPHANQAPQWHMDWASWWKEAKQDKDYLGDSKRMQCFSREGCRRSSLYLQILHKCLVYPTSQLSLVSFERGKNSHSFINCQGSCLKGIRKGKQAVTFAYPICQEQDFEQTATTKPPAKYLFLQFIQ